MADPDKILEFFTSYLGVNPSVGCPNACAYCVLDRDMPNPTKIVHKGTPAYTLDLLLEDSRVTKYNPLTFYNLSDPFLKENVSNLLQLLEGLEKNGHENIAVLITKLNPSHTTPEENVLERIAQLKNIKPVILVSYANNPKNVEPVSKSKRLELMAEAKEKKIPILQYARPLWEGWTPKDKVQEMVQEVARIVDGVILGGVLTTKEIKKTIADKKAPVPDWDNTKGRFLDHSYEQFVLHEYQRVNPSLPVFLNSSCAISFAAKVPHYQGYYGLFSNFSNNLERRCQRPCAPVQLERCAKAEPSIKKDHEGYWKVVEWLKRFGAEKAMFQIEKGYIDVFAHLTRQDGIWMRQHTGMYIYFGAKFGIFNHHPRVK